MALVDELRGLINHSRMNAIAKGATDEPALVAEFFKDLLSKASIDSLGAHLGANLPPGTEVLVQGVFAHQNPYAVFPLTGTGRARAEIGDLLLVREHFPPHDHPERRAFLVQAKTNSGPATGSLNAKNEPNQFELYKAWPQFDFTPTFRKTYAKFRPPSAPLDFSVGHDTTQARYAVIADKNVISIGAGPWTPLCSWVICHDLAGSSVTASTGITFELSMDEVLEKFVNFGWGRPCSVHVDKSDWSQYVEFVLRLTTANHFRHPLVGPRVRSVLSGVSRFFNMTPASVNTYQSARYLDSAIELNMQPRSAQRLLSYFKNGPPFTSNMDFSLPGPNVLYVATFGPERYVG